jgi:hypothetical protein
MAELAATTPLAIAFENRMEQLRQNFTFVLPQGLE